jgi:hypothetical protein
MPLAPVEQTAQAQSRRLDSEESCDFFVGGGVPVTMGDGAGEMGGAVADGVGPWVGPTTAGGEVLGPSEPTSDAPGDAVTDAGVGARAGQRGRVGAGRRPGWPGAAGRMGVAWSGRPVALPWGLAGGVGVT